MTAGPWQVPSPEVKGGYSKDMAVLGEDLIAPVWHGVRYRRAHDIRENSDTIPRDSVLPQIWSSRAMG